MNIVFSIYIDISLDKLDNPAGYDWKTGKKEKTNKSLEVKTQLAKHYDRLAAAHEAYAHSIGAYYVLHEYDDRYEDFCKMFKKRYSQISEYDIINFYKHWLMKEYAKEYDSVCYLDFDVVPNTNESIFEAHNINTHFACAEQNADALWGKTCKAEDYTTCIRNPSSKYWNCHALLMEYGYDGDTDVFNTGIMVANKRQIEKLDYFGDFEDILDTMTDLKKDKFSMYPHQIQRVFNYDNETIFAFKRVINNVDIDYMNDLWHNRLTTYKQWVNPDAKMYHVIHKRFSDVI